MTNKFIIKNNSKVDDLKLFSYIQEIIELGLISGNDNLYCYLTRFKDGTIISFDKTKYGYSINAWFDERVGRKA